MDRRLRERKREEKVAASGLLSARSAAMGFDDGAEMERPRPSPLLGRHERLEQSLAHIVRYTRAVSETDMTARSSPGAPHARSARGTSVAHRIDGVAQKIDQDC